MATSSHVSNGVSGRCYRAVLCLSVLALLFDQAQPALADIDVELVSMPVEQCLPVREPPRKMSLTRREWILLGIGAGAVIFAGIVGMIVALIVKG